MENKNVRYSKVIISGSIVEFFKFFGAWSELGVFNSDNVARSRSRVRRLINANAGHWYTSDGKRYLPLFLTFTFAENVRDVSAANPLFTSFVKRVNFDFFGSRRAVLKYLTVIEFQKRGAVHYHSLFFNVPFVQNLYDRLSVLWPHGYIYVNPIKQVRNVGAYVVKYMTKSARDERLKGKKTYFSSRGLIRSDVLRDDFDIKNVLDTLDGVVPSIFETDNMFYARFFAPFWTSAVGVPKSEWLDPLLNQGSLFSVVNKNSINRKGKL